MDKKRDERDGVRNVMSSRYHVITLIYSIL